jgi:ATP-binding cassette, subfamily B, bacterial
MAEEESSLRGGLAMLWGSIRMHPRPFSVGILGAAMYAAGTVAATRLLKWVIDKVIRVRFEQGSIPTRTVMIAAGAIVLLGAFRSFSVILRRSFATRGVNAVTLTLRSRVIEQFSHRPIHWFDERETGTLMANAGVDTDAVGESLAPLPLTVGVLFLLIFSGASLLVTDPVLGGVAIMMFPLLMLVSVRYQRAQTLPMKRAQDALGDLANVVHESVDGAVVVKAFGAAALERERFDARAETLRAAKLVTVRKRANFIALFGFIPNLSSLVLLVVGAYRVRSGALTIGDVTSVLYLFTLLVWPLGVVGYMMGDMTHGYSGWVRLRAMLASDNPAVVQMGTPPAGEAVSVRGVGFAYENGRDVLNDVDLSVPLGQVIALVGATGSGKTTLLELLAGLRSPDRGTVSTVGGPGRMVFQEPFLFAGSLLDNVDLSGKRSARVVKQAISHAQADEFVLDLPAGIDTIVGERGVSLSGGQRQRVALARAFASPSSLLLVDDATSSLDPSTEGRVLAALPEALKGGSAIIVASRPSTIGLAHQVAFMEDGHITAFGLHEDLLASLPAYRDLVEAYERDRT